jgi:hypothetical protein
MKTVIAIIAAFAVTSAGANSLPLAPVKAKPVKVSIKSKGKPHLHLPRVLKPLAKMEVDEDDDYWEEPIVGHVSYRRPELISNDELPLSDYVTLRLAHARRLAMTEYHRVWG